MSESSNQKLRGMSKYQCYKANGAKNGAASQLELKISLIGEYADRKGELFWEGANQLPVNDANDNATFDWGNKLVMKLGIPDIGELLAVLNGQKPSAGGDRGLYHQNNLGNSILVFQRFKTDGGATGYNVRLSSKRNEELKQVKHSLTIGEGEILRVLLERAVAQFYGW